MVWGILYSTYFDVFVKQVEKRLKDGFYLNEFMVEQ